LLLCARAFIGPFTLFVSVNRPLNLQSIFGLSVTLALLCGATSASSSENSRARFESITHTDWAVAVSTVLLAFLAFGQNLSSFFLSDDFYLLDIARNVGQNTSALLIHGGGKEFFRPVGGLLLLATSGVAGLSPFWWHLVSLLLHSANALLILALAKRLFDDKAVGYIAAVLFVTHGTTPEAVAWVAGRFDLIATFFLLVGLLSWLRYYRTGRRSAMLVSITAMALGMLSKESAYVFPFLLLILLAKLPDASRRKWRETWIVWGVAVTMFVIRWTVLGGIGGYVDASTNRAEVFSLDALKLVKVLGLRIWSAFWFPLNWSVEPSLVLSILLTLNVAALLWLMSTAVAKRRDVLFCLAVCVISCLPGLHQLLIGSDLQKSRLLYLPLVGFCLLAGVAFSALSHRKAQLLATAALLIFHVACLQHNLAIWREVAALADHVCSRIANELPPSATGLMIKNIPGSINGVYFLRNGLGGCIDLKAGRPLHLQTAAGDPGTLVLQWNDLTATSPNRATTGRE
jgi:hypothetical protein